MLNYLKEHLADIQRQQQEAVQESAQPTDAQILEYASLFSELDDLTENGSRAATAVRTPVSIPLENDFEVELNTVTMNVSDGRITDIPADATVTEAFEIASPKYTAMKTRDEFVQEAYAAVTMMPRETRERYQARVNAYVNEQWSAYNQYITQEGLFGHDKVDLNDAVVPDKVTIDFGPKKGTGNYMVTIPVKWETDKKQRVTRKQIDSVGIFQRMPADIWGEVTDNVMKSVSDKYNVDSSKDKWDILTPTAVIVPIDPADQYAIIVEFDTDVAKDPIYWRLMLPVKAGSHKSVESAKDLFDGGSPKCSELFSQANRMDVMRKRDFKLEFAEMQRPSRFGNRTPHYYTEGIDFGGGAATPDAAPPPEMAGAAPDANGGPTVNVGAPDANAAAPTDAAPAPDGQQVTIPASVNDVSNDIAQNVAAQTQADDEAANADIDINVDDVDADINTDLGVDNVEAGTDSQLDSLDDVDPTTLPSDDPGMDSAADDTGVPDMSNVDMDNMTVDQLIEQGAEKLKGMTLNQLKEFLNSPDGTSPEDVATESYYMLESFFTRDDNVRKRIDTSLNDVIKGFKKIVKGFEEDDWDREDFNNFWHASARVHKNADNSTWDDPYATASSTGAYFAASVSDLQHYLKIAVKKKRARGAFTDEDRKKLEEFNDSLKKYVNDADNLASITGKRHDVDISDVLEATKKLLAKCEDAKSLIGSKKFAESYVFEAAVITKKNVRSQIQEHIKSALGILNNTEFNFRELVEAFRKEGKALNKTLTKATKMKKIFTNAQINDIDKLNSILVDLQSNMRLNALNEDYTKKVKGLISDFAQQCKKVNDSLEGKAVQEACCGGPDTVKEFTDNGDDIRGGVQEPTNVNEEDDMSYSANDSQDDAAGSSSDPVDGADVGGVDFESEGVQRAERVRQAKAADAMQKVDPSMSRSDAKKLTRDLHSYGGGLTARKLADSSDPKDQALLAAHGSAITPKHTAQLEDSWKRSKAQRDKIHDARKAMTPAERELDEEQFDKSDRGSSTLHKFMSTEDNKTALYKARLDVEKGKGWKHGAPEPD